MEAMDVTNIEVKQELDGWEQGKLAVLFQHLVYVP